MMVSSFSRLLATTFLSFFFFVSQAQPPKKETKPYQVITTGKEITIKSSRNIQHVMLWTTNGHRVVEQREINSPSFSFSIPLNDKIYFLMVGLENNKFYTEKIGIQQ
ncbi:MAG: hypothetical protein ACRDEB_09230 [Chitinophagaceae bacterium]